MKNLREFPIHAYKSKLTPFVVEIWPAAIVPSSFAVFTLVILVIVFKRGCSKRILQINESE